MVTRDFRKMLKFIQRGNFKKLDSKDLKFFQKFNCQTKDLDAFNFDWTKNCKGSSTLVLKPKNTIQVSEILAYCNINSLAVVPQGGYSLF